MQSPPRPRTTTLRSVPALVALLATAPLLAAQQAPFDVLDDVEAPWVNLNFQTVRPILLVPKGAGEELWTLDTQDSTVRKYPSVTATGPSFEVRVPWGPVALAYWDASPFVVVPAGASSVVEPQPIPTAVDAIQVEPTPANFPDQILVTSKGSRVLTYLDRNTGAVLRMKELPDEPGDIAVVGNMAFVACAAEDVVVQVNLVTNTIVRTYTIPSKHPLFLTVEPHAGGQATVLVTPMLSGNDSTPENFPGARRAGKLVLDLSDPDVAQTGLPDQDAFRIDPAANTVTPVVRAAGTVLFGSGRNPVTGALWILNTEANNKDPERQTEPSIAGEIVRNRLSIASLPPLGSSAPLEPPQRIVELDDVNPFVPGVQHDRDELAVAMPYALAFDSQGRGYATGLSSDVVVVLAPNGHVLDHFDLPERFAPRGIAVTKDDARIVVWSQNRPELRVYEASGPHALVAVHDLGFDPTPELVARGRGIFYDADFSRNDDATCATCHVDGRNDLLTWQLSEGHSDGKGPMFTQTLVGIEKLLPYHWRGERADLIDFNPAFEGLLGGRELTTGPGSEFEAFRAFVFSLQNSPNPFEHPSRMLDDSIQPPRLPNGVASASAVNGKALFSTLEVVGDLDCTECHTLPTGTNNDIFADDTVGHLPRRTHFKVTPFNGAWRKGMPLVEVELVEDGVVQPPEELPLLGAGVSHAGRVLDLLDFLADAVGDEQQQADVTSFLHQLDQGIAPVVSRAWLLNPHTAAAVEPKLLTELMPQAGTNCDVIAYGFVELAGTPTPLRWAYDEAAGEFVPEDSNVPRRTLADFLLAAPVESNVFEAVPLGSGERHGIDFDGDGLPNLDELAAGTDPFDPDFDGDGFPDGHELAHGGSPTGGLAQPADGTPPVISGLAVPWHTTRVARLRFETDEPTRYVIDYRTSAPPPFDGGVVASEGFARTHSLVLRGLLPSTPGGPSYTYDVEVRAIDPQGNADVETVAFTTLDAIHISSVDAVVGEVRRTKLAFADAGATIELSVRIRVDEKLGGFPRPPSPNRAVVARVLVGGRVSDAFEPIGGASFRVKDFTASGAASFTKGFVPGPYLVSLATDSNGETELAFRLERDRLRPEQEIRLNVEAVLRVADPVAFEAALQACGGDFRCVPDLPTLDTGRALTRWDMPDTAPEARGHSITAADLLDLGGPWTLPFPGGGSR